MNKLKTLRALSLGLLLGGSSFVTPSIASAQSTDTYVPSPENLEARKDFANDKFGIFLHWGLYSMFAQGEWYMQTDGIDCHEYAKAASGFYPSKFNVKEWVTAFKNAGAKYICFTSRHHEGFSMFDTQYSDYDIMDATPFKRDIVKELADECHKQGIDLHLYYSHLDWTREDYYPLGSTGKNTGRKKHGEWKTYYEFMNNQLTELLTNYGKIRAIWFDGMWDQPADFDWKLEEQYALIHRLQPACLVGNNHHKAPFAGEDFQMFERDLPGENKAGFSKGTAVATDFPLETCETMNGMWGYRIKDQDYKSVPTLIRLLVGAAGKGANLLINIGPQANGELPALALERLKGMGEWLNRYGETVYNTTRGDVMKADWGTTTRKGDLLYVHILADKMPKTITLSLDQKVKEATLFETGEKVAYKATKKDGKNKIVLQTAGLKPSADCILTLKLK